MKLKIIIPKFKKHCWIGTAVFYLHINIYFSINTDKINNWQCWLQVSASVWVRSVYTKQWVHIGKFAYNAISLNCERSFLVHAALSLHALHACMTRRCTHGNAWLTLWIELAILWGPILCMHAYIHRQLHHRSLTCDWTWGFLVLPFSFTFLGHHPCF